MTFALLFLTGTFFAQANTNCPSLPWGIHSTDVTQNSVILWTRIDSSKVPLEARFKVNDTPPMSWVSFSQEKTWITKINHLLPGKTYSYELQIKGCPTTAKGQFKTLSPTTHQLHLLWGADIGGQGLCHSPENPYRIFNAMSEQEADLFLALGDLIYADDPCHTFKQPASSHSDFEGRYLYQFRDLAYQNFLAQTPTLATWDDHEIRDDFDSQNTPLFEKALNNFLLAFPVDNTDPKRIYRKRKVGSLVEIFILDTRQYRSPNSSPDSSKKTMLGSTQLEWLLSGLKKSTSTWKVIVSSVPISFPTGKKHPDGWTGFKTEFSTLYQTIKKISNVIVLSADAHLTLAIHYPNLKEYISGPLHAGFGKFKPIEKDFHPKILFKKEKKLNFGSLILSPQKAQIKLINQEGITLYKENIKSR